MLWFRAVSAIGIATNSRISRIFISFQHGAFTEWSLIILQLHQSHEDVSIHSSLKWLHSKQPKLGLTQEFVEDCAHALWVVHTTKRLVSLMLLKGFLSDSFI